MQQHRDTGDRVAVGVVPDTLEVGENYIRTDLLMQAQVLTVTASVPGKQQCTNKENVLQEGRSATSVRRCHTFTLLSVYTSSLPI